MKKRIIALLCALTILLPCTMISAQYSDIPEGTNEERIVDIISKLGIMIGYEDNGVRTFQPDSPITRAEFVTAMRNCIRFWNNVGATGSDEENALLAEILGFNWNEFAYGDDPDLELLYPSEGEQTGNDATATSKKYLWSDVDEEHWAYTNMRDMSVLGVIKGYPDGTFRPNNNVSYNEAVTIILSLCGYADYAAATGGWPEGYTKLASRFGMNKGITTTGDSPLSRMEVATLVYNSFKVELTSPLMSENEHKNFLNDIIGVYLLEGTLERTDITSIYDEEINGRNTMTVDGADFIVSSESDIRDYIGREIRVFLKKVDEEYVMQTFEPTNREKSTVIDIAHFENYASRTFYYKKDENSSEKSIKVRMGSVLIYNGKYMPEYSSTTFENLNQGTITIVEKKDFEYDIIVVENFESGYFDSVNTGNMEIIDKVATTRGKNPIIKLKDISSEEPTYYDLYDKNGNEILFEDLRTGAINYYVNGNYVKLYYSEETVSGIVSSSVTEDGIKTVVIGENQYNIAKQYTEAGGSTRNGLSVKVTIDSFGEIVWIEDADSSLENYVYVIKARRDYENECIILKYYDIAQKAVLETTTLNTVKMTDRYGESTDVDMHTLYDNLSNYDGVIKLKSDSEGKIVRIIMPLDKDANSDKDKLKLVLETNEISGSENHKDNFIFLGGALSGKYYTDSNTVIMRVPKDREAYEKYTVMPSNTRLGWTTTTLCKLYAFDAEAPFMNIVLLYDLSAESTTAVTTAYSGFVTAVNQSINEDNEFTTEVELFTTSKGETIRVSAVQDENGLSLFEKAGGAYINKDTNTYKVSRGDFIKISVDSVDGEVNDVQLVFDADGVNPAWCMNDTVNKPTVCPAGHTHSTNITGSFAGGNGYVHTKENTKYGNPLGYSHSSWDASGYNTGRFQLVPGATDNASMWTFGFIHSVKDGLLRVTTQNLKENWDKKESPNFYWTYDRPDKANVWIYEDGEYSRGEVNDIRTYEQVGKDCDKLLMHSGGGTMNLIVILRG